MERTKVEIEIGNIFDESKRIKSFAFVDTHASNLCLPRKIIEELGLKLHKKIKNKRFYTDAVLIVNNEQIEVEVLELSDELPPFLGIVPLEIMKMIDNEATV